MLSSWLRGVFNKLLEFKLDDLLGTLGGDLVLVVLVGKNMSGLNFNF